MPVKVDPYRELAEQVRQLADQRTIPLPQAFVVWFLKAFADASDDESIGSLAGANRDKGIDAIYVDDDADIVFIVQGKYRRLGAGAENRSEIIAFANLADRFLGREKDIEDLVVRADPSQHKLMRRAYKRVQQGHQLQLHF